VLAKLFHAGILHLPEMPWMHPAALLVRRLWRKRLHPQANLRRKERKKKKEENLTACQPKKEIFQDGRRKRKSYVHGAR